MYIRLTENIINKKPIYNIEISFNNIMYIVGIKMIYYKIYINNLFIKLHILYKLNLTPECILLREKNISHFAQLLKVNTIT